MSDPFFGTSGSDVGENPSAAIIIDTKSVTDAVNVIKAASKSMETSFATLNSAIVKVEASLKTVSAAARIAILEARTAASKAAADATNARTNLAKQNFKSQTSRQDHLQTMKDKSAVMKADDQAHQKYMQNSRVRSQTSKQNHQVVMAGFAATKQAADNTHKQQMGALNSTRQISKQNHQVTMGTMNQQNLALKQTGQILKQNHQIAIQGSNQVHQVVMSNLNAQNKMAINNNATQNKLAVLAARQAGQGGGLGGLLGGIGGGLRGLGGGGAGAAGGVAGLLGAFAGGGIAGIAANSIKGLVEGLTHVVAASDEVARAYDRQELAGRTLAGSQQELNELMAVYDKATGEALSKSKQMQNVVRLQAVGFADSKTEIDQFSRAIRGISLAIGEPADYVTQNLILELFSMRGQRLDQLGLQYDKVREKQEELMQSDAGLTKQQAYQQAVLDQALDRYGELSTSLEGNATGVESLAAAWDDLGLAMAQWIQGPANGAVQWLADIAQGAADAVSEMSKVKPEDVQYPVPAGGYSRSQREFGGIGPDTMSINETQAVLRNAQARKAQREAEEGLNAFITAMGAAVGISQSMEEIDETIKQAQRNLSVMNVMRQRSEGYRDPTPGGGTYNDNPAQIGLTDDQLDEIRSFSRARAELEADTNQAIIDENRDYSQRRLDIEADFQQRMAEEAADFARKRARDIAEFEEDIAEAAADAAEKRLDIEEDLQKTLARMNRDYAQEVERSNRDHAKRLEEYREEAKEDEEDEEKEFAEEQAEARKDSAERLTEMEEEYGRDREKAARAHNESILKSASQLDAAAVFWEQKKYARERKEAEEEHARKIEEEKETLEEELSENEKAHQERMSEIRENLKEQIDEENEAHATKTADAKAAHEQQLKDQIDAANERLTEIDNENFQRMEKMKKDFGDRLTEEDTERGIRLGREYEHHNKQLGEMDRVHGERITQIGTHAAKERAELDRQHRQAMLDLGFHNAAWEEVERRANAIALQQHKIFLLEDQKMAAELRQAELQRKLTEPTATAEEKEIIAGQIGWLGDQIRSIGGLITDANTALGELPRPEDVITEKGLIEEQGQVSGGSVDLGMWKGKSGEPLVGAASSMMGSATSIVIESGAIVINTLPGQTQAGIGDDFEERLLRTLKKVAKTG